MLKPCNSGGGEGQGMATLVDAERGTELAASVAHGDTVILQSQYTITLHSNLAVIVVIFCRDDSAARG